MAHRYVRQLQFVRPMLATWSSSEVSGSESILVLVQSLQGTATEDMVRHHTCKV